VHPEYNSEALTMEPSYLVVKCQLHYTGQHIVHIIFRAIINHFSPKIEAWLASQGLSTPSEDQVNVIMYHLSNS
jgi:hypothetical protein